MAQEAFNAAGDPTKFPEQLREGLRPWSPLKVYERVPNFSPTKQNTIYDYATDKYVPIRFYDYINKTWLTGKPSVNVTIPTSKWDPATGLTYLQMGREGWGFQKSQNGGGTLPLPSIASSSYHRYGSRVSAGQTESSFYDGIDTSLSGIASSGNRRYRSSEGRTCSTHRDRRRSGKSLPSRISRVHRSRVGERA